MGHTIYGMNQAGDFLCSLRFSMGNYTSYAFYDFFDAEDFHGGVSGVGQTATYTTSQVEAALKLYEAHYNTDSIAEKVVESDFEAWERKEILTFIKCCLEVTEKEGTVDIFYG